MAENERAVDDDQPLLIADGLSKSYGRLTACRDVSFALYPGEVLAIVGESGSGKTTLLQLLSAQLAPSAGSVSYRMRDGVMRDLAALGEAERRFLFRTDWGYVHQDPAQGLRMAVSAGANVGERLMAVGWNHMGAFEIPRHPGWNALRSTLIASTMRRGLIRAACGSGCRSRAIWSRSRAWYSWTSRPEASMCRCRRACSI